jgi:putative phosphoesterase
MKIAIISDTHGNVANFKKTVNWLNKENIRTILHCGDIGDPGSLKESLEDFKGECFGVFGNMDKSFKILVDEYNKIPKVKIEEDIFETEIGGKKIIFTHFPDAAKKLAQSGKYDLVFYGHTHRPWDEKISETHMINPGELAGQFYKPTFAVYDTETSELQLKILEKL